MRIFPCVRLPIFLHGAYSLSDWLDASSYNTTYRCACCGSSDGTDAHSSSSDVGTLISEPEDASEPCSDSSSSSTSPRLTFEVPCPPEADEVGTDCAACGITMIDDELSEDSLERVSVTLMLLKI